MVAFVWLALIILGIFIEAATPQLVSVWFVLGAVAALVSSLFGAPIWLQVAIAVVVSLIAMAAIKPFAQRFVDKRVSGEKADRCMGQEGIVTSAVNGEKGRVIVSGKSWAALSADGSRIPKGVKVEVVEAVGVKLSVRAIH